MHVWSLVLYWFVKKQQPWWFIFIWRPVARLTSERDIMFWVARQKFLGQGSGGCLAPMGSIASVPGVWGPRRRSPQRLLRDWVFGVKTMVFTHTTNPRVEAFQPSGEGCVASSALAGYGHEINLFLLQRQPQNYKSWVKARVGTQRFYMDKPELV